MPNRSLSPVLPIQDDGSFFIFVDVGIPLCLWLFHVGIFICFQLTHGISIFLDSILIPGWCRFLIFILFHNICSIAIPTILAIVNELTKTEL